MKLTKIVFLILTLSVSITGFTASELSSADDPNVGTNNAGETITAAAICENCEEYKMFSRKDRQVQTAANEERKQKSSGATSNSDGESN